MDGFAKSSLTPTDSMSSAQSTNSKQDEVMEPPPVFSRPAAPLDEEQQAGVPTESSEKPQSEPVDIWDWEGPNDPANPRNWPLWKRAYHTALPALYAFIITITTSVCVPGLPFIMEEFSVSREVAILALSLYTLGLAVGPIVTAPLSEILGRRILYHVGLILLLAFEGGASAAQNIETLIICRFLAGAGGAGAVAIGAGSLSDIWDPMEMGAGIASLLYTLGPFLGPTLGPLTGAYIIAEYNNRWRYTLWITLIIGAPLALLSIFMRETSKKQILLSRHRSRGLTIPKDDPHLQISTRALLARLALPIRMMFTEPLVAYLSLYGGFAFAMLFSFFGSYFYIYESVYHFNEQHVGLAFLAILVGFMAAIIMFMALTVTVVAKEGRKVGGLPEPEWHLLAGMIGSVLLPIGLFWAAWTSRAEIHWIVPILAGIPFGWGMLSIFLSATVYLLNVYRSSNGASALAATGILRFALGAAFPLFTVQLYESRIGIHWAGSVFAFASLGLLPIPWVFFRYGRGIRARSSLATGT